MRKSQTFLLFLVICERARHKLWMWWAWTLRDKNLSSCLSKNSFKQFVHKWGQAGMISCSVFGWATYWILTRTTVFTVDKHASLLILSYVYDSKSFIIQVHLNLTDQICKRRTSFVKLERFNVKDKKLTYLKQGDLTSLCSSKAPSLKAHVIKISKYFFQNTCFWLETDFR
jgi:hypothetical protein